MAIPELKELLKSRISKHLNAAISSLELSQVGGGSINDTYQVQTDGGIKFFLKLNSAIAFPGLFEKEKNGLEFLGTQNCILVPSVLMQGMNDTHQWLLLEWVEEGTRDQGFWKKFGEQLARLHTISQAYFGFVEDNYMGSLPQANSFTDDWPEFFARYRLWPQIELAASRHFFDKSHLASFDALFRKTGSIFNSEKPSLLHGDLWSGNFMCNDRSLPVLIDPAVYFGHRNMDLAMTTLFGGFDKLFYEAYHYHSPLPSNYRDQWQLCNLYPLLIHLNLFGRGYLPEILDTLKKFR